MSVLNMRPTQRWLDRGIAIVGLLAALAMFPLRFFVSHVFASTLPIVLGSGCLLYLLADRSERRNVHGVAFPTIPEWSARTLPGVVFLLLSMMVVATALLGERGTIVYDLTIVAGVLVLTQILFVADDDLHPGLLLAQVFALAGVMRFGVVLTTPHYVGVDILTHLDAFATMISQQDTLNAIRGDKYWAAPLYHLYVVATSGMTGLEFGAVVYFFLELFMLAAGLFIYSTTREFVAPRWATFATAAFVLSDEWMQWSIHLIPTSIAAAFYLAAFFLLIRVLLVKTERNTLLLTFFLVAVGLTHQVGAFIMLMLLGSAFLVQLVLWLGVPYDDVKATNLFSLLLFYGGFLTFLWSVTPLNGETFVTRMLLNVQQTVRSTLGFGNIQDNSVSEVGREFLPPEVVQVTPFEKFVEYIDYLGFLLLLAVAIIGFLYILRRSNASHALLTLFVASVLMSVFTLGLPLFGVSSFLPGRWYVFMYAPLVVAGAIGFAYVRQYLPGRGTAVVFVLFILIFPNAMFLSHDATFDRPAFPSEQPRYSYTENELATAETLSQLVGDETPIWADNPYTELFMRSHDQLAAMMRLNPNEPVPNEYVLYRQYDSDGAPYYRGVSRAENESRAFTWIKQIPPERICTADRSVVYASDNTRLCVKDIPNN